MRREIPSTDSWIIHQTISSSNNNSTSLSTCSNDIFISVVFLPCWLTVADPKPSWSIVPNFFQCFSFNKCVNHIPSIINTKICFNLLCTFDMTWPSLPYPLHFHYQMEKGFYSISLHEILFSLDVCNVHHTLSSRTFVQGDWGVWKMSVVLYVPFKWLV